MSDASEVEPLPADLAEVMSAVSDLYGVGIGQPKLFKGEFDRNVRFADPTHGMLLVKVSSEALSDAEIRWQEAVLQAAAEDPQVTFRTPTILPARDGSLHVRTGAHLVRVVTWISGRLWNENPGTDDADPQLLASLGRASARLTLALSAVTMPAAIAGHDWMIERGPLVVDRAVARLAESPAVAAEKLAVVNGITRRFSEETLPRLAALPRSVIHHDLHDANVVLDDAGTAVAGVIDFNDAVCAPRISDLAISGAYAMLGHSDPSAAFGCVVDGYRSIVEPESAELEIVADMALMRLCMNWAQWQARALDSADNDYALSRSARTWPLIAHLAEVGPPSV